MNETVSMYLDFREINKNKQSNGILNRIYHKNKIAKHLYFKHLAILLGLMLIKSDYSSAGITEINDFLLAFFLKVTIPSVSANKV